MSLRRRPIVLTAAVGVLAGLVLAPAVALAGWAHGRAGGGHVGGGHVGGTRPPAFAHPSRPASHLVRPGSHASRPGPHHRRPGQHFGKRHHDTRRSFVGVFASPVVMYAPSPLYYEAAAYAPSPGYYDAASYYEPAVYYEAPAYPPTANVVSVAPSPPPTPSVIEYPTGRYELRGDGATSPYIWVWIPNPPPPPPAAPPAVVSEPDAPARARRSRVFRWTDAEGVTHLTDRSDAVPEQYRTEVK